MSQFFVFKAVSEVWRGLGTFIHGVSWLLSRPKYLFLLFIPMILGVFFLVGGFALFALYGDFVFDKIMFAKPEGWWWFPV